jgi:mannose-6-phosphate isomerase-like protein (cupin superfamily)
VASSGDVIENPVTGQHLKFLVCGSDSDGELFRAEGTFPPRGFAGVEHVHPKQDEHFAVLSGQAAFTVKGVERVLGAGETIEVSAGTSHTFRNAGDDEMRVVFEFRPAPESTRHFYELYFGFAQEGRVNAKALPGLLDIALIWPLVSDHAVLATPPAWVQNAIFGVLGPIARASRRPLPSCAAHAETPQSPGVTPPAHSLG